MKTIKINVNNGNLKRFVLPYADPNSSEAKAAAKEAKAAAAKRRKAAKEAAAAEKRVANVLKKAALQKVAGGKKALSNERKTLGATIRLIAESDSADSQIFKRVTGLSKESSAKDRRAVMQWILSIFPTVRYNQLGQKIFVKKAGPKNREKGIFWIDITDMLEAVNTVVKLSVTQQLTGFQNVVADARPDVVVSDDPTLAERNSIVSPLLAK